MWLRIALDKTKMADNVSVIVKVLCGSFYVNSERFSGQDEVFYCKSCGNFILTQLNMLCYIAVRHNWKEKNSGNE